MHDTLVLVAWSLNFWTTIVMKQSCRDRCFLNFHPPTFLLPSVATCTSHSISEQKKNLNEFVVALEKESHNAGYENVICNRLVPVKRTSDGKPDVKGVPISDNSFDPITNLKEVRVPIVHSNAGLIFTPVFLICGP